MKDFFKEMRDRASPKKASQRSFGKVLRMESPSLIDKAFGKVLRRNALAQIKRERFFMQFLNELIIKKQGLPSLYEKFEWAGTELEL